MISDFNGEESIGSGSTGILGSVSPEPSEAARGEPLEERPRNERRLIERLEAGDEAAYAELVSTYGGRMLAVARRILGNDEDAQDALQDAFVSVFRSLPRFQGSSQLGTWLHRIAINAALMKLRSARRRNDGGIDELLPRFQDDGHHLEPPRTWVEPADDPVIRDEMRGIVRACIDQLPDAYRVALVLRDIEQLDNEQVAERLGTSVNAAKIRVHRARQALRALLDPYMGSGSARHGGETERTPAASNPAASNPRPKDRAKARSDDGL